eukprot:TRINITY_DN24373_c0_g1_i1.p1 TRINITY_DN24373_c0_g1~~TRINITY_DN24373_c0_g1_i1.p1  ORF type:complete len:403 (+),score=38.84 TRINITY_DN24373_c0_g1_i1:138-1346(+)
MSHTGRLRFLQTRQADTDRHAWDVVLFCETGPPTMRQSRLGRELLQDSARHAFSKTSLKRTGHLCLNASCGRAEFESIPGGLALSGFARHFSSGTLINTSPGKEPVPTEYRAAGLTSLACSLACSIKDRDASNKSEDGSTRPCAREHDLSLPPLPVSAPNFKLPKPIAERSGQHGAAMVHREKAIPASAVARLADGLRVCGVQPRSFFSLPRLPKLGPELDNLPEKEPVPAEYLAARPTSPLCSPACSTTERDASNKSKEGSAYFRVGGMRPAACAPEHDLSLPPLPVSTPNIKLLKNIAERPGQDRAEAVHREKALASAIATLADGLRVSGVQPTSLRSSSSLPQLPKLRPEVDKPSSSPICLPALRKSPGVSLRGSRQKYMVRFNLHLNEELQYTMMQSF